MELRWRLIFAILGCMGMGIIYGLKVNLSVAIVAMVNQTAVKELQKSQHHETTDHDAITLHDSGAPTDALICKSDSDHDQEDGSGHETGGSTEEGTLVWTEVEQGLVLGSYFWGYFVTQVPGGRVAELYSGKWLFFVAVIMNVVGAIFSPVAAIYGGYPVFILMRVLQGLGGGFTFPAMNVLIAAWAPNTERSTISSLVYGGTAIGTVLSMPSAGLIAHAVGWEGIFYIQGGLALIWCLMWAVLVTDTPAQHRWISETEKEHILQNQTKKESGPKPRVPWVSILTSVPFWALCIAHTINNFCWYMLLVELPTFLSVGLGFSIKDNALLSAVPFLCNWILSIIYSSCLDKAIQKKWLSITNARKLSQIIASVIPGACLVGVCLAGCDRSIVVVLMIIATAFFGTMFSGVFSNHTDIASNFAGILMGFTNMVATIPGFLVPAMVGAMTHGVPGLEPWHQIFYITVGLLGVEILVYGIFGSGVEQPWNRSAPPPDTEDGNKEEKMKMVEQNDGTTANA